MGFLFALVDFFLPLGFPPLALDDILKRILMLKYLTQLNFEKSKIGNDQPVL